LNCAYFSLKEKVHVVNPAQGASSSLNGDEPCFFEDKFPTAWGEIPQKTTIRSLHIITKSSLILHLFHYHDLAFPMQFIFYRTARGEANISPNSNESHRNEEIGNEET
jgi:hypothetical protein